MSSVFTWNSRLLRKCIDSISILTNEKKESGCVEKIMSILKLPITHLSLYSATGTFRLSRWLSSILVALIHFCKIKITKMRLINTNTQFDNKMLLNIEIKIRIENEPLFVYYYSHLSENLDRRRLCMSESMNWKLANQNSILIVYSFLVCRIFSFTITVACFWELNQMQKRFVDAAFLEMWPRFSIHPKVYLFFNGNNGPQANKTHPEKQTVNYKLHKLFGLYRWKLQAYQWHFHWALVRIAFCLCVFAQCCEIKRRTKKRKRASESMCVRFISC